MFCSHLYIAQIIHGVSPRLPAGNPPGSGRPRQPKMSVRDKIASFGGAGSSSSSSNGFASTARIGTNIPPSSSNARAFPHETTTYSGATGAGDAVRKLNVPSVFKNATKPADVPAPAATAQPSVSGAAKKWGAPATKAGAPSGAASGGSNSSAVVAGFSAGNGPASRWGPPAHGDQNGGYGRGNAFAFPWSCLYRAACRFCLGCSRRSLECFPLVTFQGEN